MRSALFWLSPMINILLVKLLKQIGFRNTYIVNIKEKDNIFIDLISFLSAFTILYFYLYLVLVNKFKKQYKRITIGFSIFQIIMLLIIITYYRIDITLIDFLYTCLYFIPFYIVAYLLKKDK